ncbi:extracellular solute-binding protein [Streptomyces sp. NBC_00588]|uniref:extracellular solute-binding protein n=1 Tax=Streptomyces sp. NBC_00588 TaxID=2975784 RepID=UPI002E808B63|nr:extracellular solute-binding protein [Streptomyces sp. NBC_00588]WUB34255.1 extracellular solute-binding protein [Streptomyces sp. NBC_00588]
MRHIPANRPTRARTAANASQPSVRSRRLRLPVAIGMALVTGASLSACGTGASAAGLPSTTSDLVKQAKKEGTVAWSAPKPQSQMQPAIDLFEKKYPGIKIKYTNTKAPDQVSQLKMEEAARKVSVDVANAGGLTVLPSLQLADDVDWAKYGIAKENVFEKNLVYIWSVPKVWAYNTDKVKPADLPKTWDDLLDPKWSGGKVSAESRASFMTVWDLDPSLGEAKSLAWAEKFAAQKPHFTPNTTQSEAPIESGQVSIGTSLINLVLQAQKKGAPVAVAPLSPTNANESYLYVPKGAPHPAAAVLLTRFLSSDAAQSVLAKTYNSRIPVDTDCSDPGDNAVLKSICDAHLKWFGTKTLDDYKSFSSYFPKAEKALGTDVG